MGSGLDGFGVGVGVGVAVAPGVGTGSGVPVTFPDEDVGSEEDPGTGVGVGVGVSPGFAVGPGVGVVPGAAVGAAFPSDEEEASEGAGLPAGVGETVRTGSEPLVVEDEVFPSEEEPGVLSGEEGSSEAEGSPLTAPSLDPSCDPEEFPEDTETLADEESAGVLSENKHPRNVITTIKKTNITKNMIRLAIKDLRLLIQFAFYLNQNSPSLSSCSGLVLITSSVSKISTSTSSSSYNFFSIVSLNYFS